MQKRKNKKGLVYFIGSLDKVIEIVIVETTFNYLMVFPNAIHTSRIKVPMTPHNLCCSHEVNIP